MAKENVKEKKEDKAEQKLSKDVAGKKEGFEKKQEAKKHAQMPVEKKDKFTGKEKADFRGRLRIAGKEINGHNSVAKALGSIKGIGPSMAGAITKIVEKDLNIKDDEMIGNLDEKQLEKVEEIVLSPQNYGLPKWLLNRNNDPTTGKDVHLIASDLDFQQKQDIKNEIAIKSYRGTRHMFGLTCRGQRTKTGGRKGLSVGVTKTKQKPGAATPGKEEKKKK